MEELLNIMRRLRDPDNGCPWDIEQDFASIAPFTIEEAYEVADAIAREDFSDLKDELGDLLLQVVFHSQMAQEAGLFDFQNVADGIGNKLRRRHPHVFGEEHVENSGDVLKVWEKKKAQERKLKGIESLMDGVPRGMPELLRAKKLQNRAAEAGFDWPTAAPILDKHEEEIGEIREAIASGDSEQIQEEIGDLLFTTVNLARKLNVDPGRALQHANRKFEGRFRSMETSSGSTEAFAKLSLEEQELLWQNIKKENVENE